MLQASLLVASAKEHVGDTLMAVWAAVRLLREELQLLQEPGSYVGEVAKVQASPLQAVHLYLGRKSSAATVCRS